MTGYVALVTLAALLFYAWTGIEVSRARVRHNISAPATTGNADFERVFRVQQNTLEWLPIFVFSLWIFAAYWPNLIAAAIGVVWIIGRFMYLQGYKSAANQRSMGFLVQAIAVLILFVGALIGVVWSLIEGTTV